MDPISQLESAARVCVRKRGAPDPDGRCVVYWMRRSLRVEDNPALEVAIRLANEIRKPLVVFFGLVPVESANLRHYTFLVQGLDDVEEDLKAKRIGFVLRRSPEHSILKFCAEVRAALLITEENPLRGPECRLQKVGRESPVPVWTVDSDVVVPSKLIPEKQYAARIIRPKLLRLRDRFLRRPTKLEVQVPWKTKLVSLPANESCLDGLKLNRSVSAVSSFRGGTQEAKRLLRQFARHKLAHYAERRNHPEIDGTSKLSPYLHFGNISPGTIARAVLRSEAPDAAKEAFLDQLITWRELAVNFVRHNELYDSLACAEPWAMRSLAKHAKDRRPTLYSEKQLENADTHDSLWNAAQIQMVEQGWMHNYMRMYWGKKILEWSRSPAEAFQIAVRLNNKYELDGRDPNGYAGIAWAIAGKLDRPWFERPIFGQVRYMSATSTSKKFDSGSYIAQHSRSRTPA